MRSFVALFGLQPDQDVRRTAIAAVKAGYAVVPVAAEGKMPLCTLNAREKKDADGHQCGVYHAITDEAVAGKVFQRLGRSGPVNLGVVARPSNLIIVDCDTAEQVQAFIDDWASHDGDDVRVYGPTQASPGLYDEASQTWLHKDGGHFLFDVPDGWDVPDGEVVKMAGGYDVKYGWSQALVSPSRRKEGPYVAQADVLDAPMWLLDAVTEKAAVKTERRLHRAAMVAHEGIAAWSVSTSWADILTPHGWTETGKLDKCGCPIFTKPGGGRTSFKSATGHEVDCDKYENVEGHGPLHIWTTEPPEEFMPFIEAGQHTLTKLQAYAALNHEGDVAEARTELDLLDESEFDDWVTSVTAVTEVPSEPSEMDRDDPDGAETLGVAEPSQPSGPDPTVFLTGAMSKFLHPDDRIKMVKSAMIKAMDAKVAQHAADEYVKALLGESVDSLIGEIDAFADLDFEAIEAIVPTVLTRSDDQALYHAGRTNWLVGRRGSGKTWLSILTCKQTVESGGTAIYFDFEDNRQLFYERAALIGFDVDAARRDKRFVYIRDFPTNAADMPAFVERVGRFDVVVFDVINRMISRLGGNPDVGNEQVIWLTDNLFDPIAAEGSCVLILDHPNKRGQGKDATVDELNPGGGAMKMNNASGVALGMLVSKPFTRQDPAGHIRLFCLKDRTGHFAEGDPVGEFRGDMDLVGDTIGLSLRIDEPDEVEEDRGIQGDIDDTKVKVRGILSAVPAGLTMGSMKSKITERLRSWLDVAVEQMEAEGEVTQVGEKYTLTKAIE